MPITEIPNPNYGQKKGIKSSWERRTEQHFAPGQNLKPVLEEYSICFYLFQDKINTPTPLFKTYYSTDDRKLTEHQMRLFNDCRIKYKNWKSVHQNRKIIAWNFWDIEINGVEAFTCVISQINIANKKSDVSIPEVIELIGINHFKI